MSFSVRVDRDDITPDLSRKLNQAKKPERIWQAAGQQLVSMTKRAFREPAMRPAPWVQKRDGSPSNLIQKGMLLSSIRIVSTTGKGVTVGSDRKYAAVHQLGAVIRAKNAKALVFTSGGKTFSVKSVRIPARPFFPFTPEGALAPQAEPKVRAIVDTATRQQLGITG